MRSEGGSNGVLNVGRGFMAAGHLSHPRLAARTGPLPAVENMAFID